MHLRSLISRGAIAAAGILFILVSCSDDPVAPPDPPTPDPDPEPEVTGPLSAVPLADGDYWTYQLRYEIRFWDQEGGSEIHPPVIVDAVGVKTINGGEDVHGVQYVLEHEVYATSEGDTLRGWRRLRQDSDGFYRLIFPLSAPPGEGGQVQTIEEVHRLHYPLEKDTRWNVYGGTGGRSFSLAEAPDTVATASGRAATMRVYTWVEGFGADDYIRVWFNRCGLVKRHMHQQFNAIDIETNEVLFVTTDEVEVMDTAAISGSGCVFEGAPAATIPTKKGGAPVWRPSLSTRALADGRVAPGSHRFNLDNLAPVGRPGMPEYGSFERMRDILSGRARIGHDLF